MRKILLIVFVLPFFAKSQVLNYNKVAGGYNYSDRLSASGALHVPAGTTPALPTGAWKRSGALFYDSTGVNKGLYIMIGNNVWVKLADTTYTGFAAKSLQQVTNVGNVTTLDIYSANSIDWYNVKRAGADTTGATDISSYIINAMAIGRKYIYIPKGTYLISSQIQMKDSVTIRGDGPLTIIKLASNITAFRCSFVGGFYCTFLDFTIKGTFGSGTTAQQGIVIDSASNLYVRNVRGYQMAGFTFRTRNNIVCCGGYVTSATRGNVITDCYNDAGYGGVMIDTSSEYSTVTNCNFIGSTYGVFIAGGNNRITNNNLSNNSYGYYQTGGFNNGHGPVSGNNINHSGIMNVYIRDVNLGMSFENNMIYAGSGPIQIRNSDNIHFRGGDIKSANPTFILDSNSTNVTFENVNMGSAGPWVITGTPPTVYTIESTGFTFWDVVNNKKFNFGYSNGQATIDSLVTASNMTNKMVMVFDSTTGNWQKIRKDSIGTGGGSSDHTALSNLGWTTSGHTGTASTFAGFNGSGAAIHPTGTGLLAFSGTTPSYNSTSSSIAGIISDETGSGAMMFGTQPTVTTGMSIAQGIITTDIKGLNVTGTWNNAGINFSGGIYVDITNTASGGSSNLLDIRLGGAQQFYVNKLGQALVTNGTATAPGWAFRDEPDMGFYRINGNQLGLTYGDAQHVVQINSTGLYLGETASGAPLATEGIFATDGVGSNANGSAMIINSGNSTGTGSSYQSFYTSTAGSSGSSANGLTEKMRITGAGNVGIGTTAPTHALTVNGQIKVFSPQADATPDSLATWKDGVLSAATVILSSGTYTPTLTNVTNVSASTAYVCQYMRVGSVVTVSGQVDLSPTAGALNTELGISLPIASALTLDRQVGGVGASESNTEAAAIFADPTNDRAKIQYGPAATGSRTIHFSFTYQIL